MDADEEMKLLLVETSAYTPVSPLFKEACEAKAKADSTFQWELHDEGMRKWLPNQRLYRHQLDFEADVILFVKGRDYSVKTLRTLKAAAKLICYQVDDPWNLKACPSSMRELIPEFDLYCTCKTAIMDDLVKAGAQKVLYVPCGYKPEIHFVQDNTIDRQRFVCDVAVIGGADEERVEIVRTLRKELPDLSIKLYGGYWDRQADLKPLHMGTVYGWEYRAAIRNAKVVLNVLRSANRDQHNMRTFEIPACGGHQLTQKTPEHDKLISYSYYETIEEIPLAVAHAIALTNQHGSQYDATKEDTCNARLDQILGAL